MLQVAHALLTSTTRLGALGPALQGPLKGVRVLPQHVVAVDGRHRILVDDVSVSQAGPGVILPRNDLCRSKHRPGTVIDSCAKHRHQGPALGRSLRPLPELNVSPTSTTTASCRGPSVCSVSVLSSMLYSHCTPRSMKDRDLASSPLPFRI